jgi:hypothetical protein
VSAGSGYLLPAFSAPRKGRERSERSQRRRRRKISRQAAKVKKGETGTGKWKAQKGCRNVESTGGSCNDLRRRHPLELTTRNATPLPPSSDDPSRGQPLDWTTADKPTRRCDASSASFACSSLCGFASWREIFFRLLFCVFCDLLRLFQFSICFFAGFA